MTENVDIDRLLATGSYRQDRHGHAAHLASADYGEPIPYSDHEQQQFADNQKLYESFWGPVPSLHTARSFAGKLRSWLRTDEAAETPRGRLLAGKPDLSGIKPLTRRWIYNASDLSAARAGCKFDDKRAKKVCDWFEAELVLYEGSAANHQFRLLAWQREMLMRLFGWVRYSSDLGKWVRRFTKASVWVPKKNGKSPLAGGIGLNLFINDDEGGQKVFNIATTLKQALIVHKHAEAFVRRKGRAKGKHNDWGCRIFKTFGDRRIGHEATASEYAAISGENPASLEGINAGGVIVDETHVMDAATAATLEEAGNSRDQPLQAEVSTTGNDLQSYGKRQFDYGRAVERGDITDQSFFFMGFGVFEETHHDLDSERTWQRCNPSWFVTIKPESFRQSRDRAKAKGIREFNKFCMYKLNKWIAAASAWLDPEDWNLCQRAWAMEDFNRARLWLGADLARCRDMSALTATARDDDRFYQRTWLWVLEEYVANNRDRCDWDLWESRGDLTIVPGRSIDTAWVREQIEVLADNHKIELVAYDQKFAGELASWLEHQAGIKHEAFPQSSTHMAGPLDEYESVVKDQRLWVQPNLCLSWQAQLASVKDTPTGGRILQKPATGEWKKIDGMVSSVMSLWACNATEPQKPTVYRKRGVLTA